MSALDVHDNKPHLTLSIQSADTFPSGGKPQYDTHNESLYTKQLHIISSQQTTRFNPFKHTIYTKTHVPWFLQWPLFFSGFTCNSYVQQMTGLIYMAICIAATIYRESQFMWYVIAGLCADAGLRVIGGDRMAVTSLCAEILTTYIPGSYNIPSAPRQFAAIFYCIWNLIAVCISGFILDGDNHRITFATLMGLEALLSLFEVFQLSLPALIFERLLVGSGLISDMYLHKAQQITVESGVLPNVSQFKSKYSGNQHVVTLTNESNHILLQHSAPIQAIKQQTLDFTANVNLLYAFPLLGIGGLIDLFYYTSELLPVDPIVFKVLIIILAILFGSFYLFQFWRLYKVPHIVFRELTHPQFRYAIMLMFGVPMLTIDVMINYSRLYCVVIYWTCSSITFFEVLLFITDWITKPISFELFNATWLIVPIVMTVASFELPILYPDLSELSWLMLGPGILIWGILIALTFCRLWFGPPLPDSQRYTLFLLMSTAGLTTAAVLFQSPVQALQFIGPYSFIATFFHWVTTFFGILMYWLLMVGYFGRSPFTMVYWGLSFPSAALALVWLFYYAIGNCGQRIGVENSPYTMSEMQCTNNQDSMTILGIVILTIVNACVSNLILALNTLLALLQKRLGKPIPRWSPSQAIFLQHTAFRTALYKINLLVQQLKQYSNTDDDGTCSNSGDSDQHANIHTHHTLISQLLPHRLQDTAQCPCGVCRSHHTNKVSEKELIQHLLHLLSEFNITFNSYITLKRDIIHPYIQTWLMDIEIHHINKTNLFTVNEAIQSILCTIHSNNINQSVIQSIQSQLDLINSLIHPHLDQEEVCMTPLMNQFTDLPASVDTLRRMWSQLEPSVWSVIIPFVLNNTSDNTLRMAFIDCFAWASSDAFRIMGRWCSVSLEPFLYNRLCVDYPQLASTEVGPMTRTW